jgi:glucose-1-phosphate thymidylyltransferase
MKGIILAGGLGTRLQPLTKITNKHLLPVYRKPIIYYPIEAMVKAGIREIMLVTGGEFAGDFLKLLGSGKEFGLKELQYTYQERPGGIAEALGLAEDFADREQVCVMLGDNIIEKNIRKAAADFARQKKGGKILLKEVEHPEAFGVPELKGNRVVKIEEKPKKPKSNYAVIGIYFYDATVFQVIQTLKRSDRGELEITDVNNHYIREETLTYEILQGWWTDAGGSLDDLYEANLLVAKTGANND